MPSTSEVVSPALLGLLASFILGSIPFAVLAMLGTGIDIRKVGSGNPGFNNVLRVSKPRAMVALIGDLGKGVLAVWLFYKFFYHGGDQVALGWLCGFAAVLGHCYSPWLKFNGGKGIATSAGVMLILYPFWAAISLVVFVIVRVGGSRAKLRESGAIASISGWVFFALLMAIFVRGLDAIYAGLMTLFLVWRHKKNLQNLLAPKSGGEWQVVSGKQ